MLKQVITIAKDAGEILKKYYGKELLIETKSGAFDFVTQADKEADAFIRAQLSEQFPGIAILSEENDDTNLDFSGRVWMVDPLDGTKDFVHKGTGFSIMIGLCENGTPTLGVLYNPITELLYYAQKGSGAFDKNGTRLKTTNVEKLTDARMITRIAHGEPRRMDALVDSLPVKEQMPMSSVGLKLGCIAEGKAELNIGTSGGTSKWDTCAPQVILEEAGGVITDCNGKPLNYKQASLRWEHSFVACANLALHKEVIAKLQYDEMTARR